MGLKQLGMKAVSYTVISAFTVSLMAGMPARSEGYGMPSEGEPAPTQDELATKKQKLQFVRSALTADWSGLEDPEAQVTVADLAALIGEMSDDPVVKEKLRKRSEKPETEELETEELETEKRKVGMRGGKKRGKLFGKKRGMSGKKRWAEKRKERRAKQSSEDSSKGNEILITGDNGASIQVKTYPLNAKNKQLGKLTSEPDELRQAIRQFRDLINSEEAGFTDQNKNSIGEVLDILEAKLDKSDAKSKKRKGQKCKKRGGKKCSGMKGKGKKGGGMRGEAKKRGGMNGRR